MFFARLCSCLSIVISDIKGGHLHSHHHHNHHHHAAISSDLPIHLCIYTGRFMAFLLSLRTVESLGMSVLLYGLLTVVSQEN